MYKFILFYFCCTAILAFGQDQPSIHQEQQEFYNAEGKSVEWYQENVNTEVFPKSLTRAEDCNLEKLVYGWHPYWSGASYLNYDWNLLSHLSYFSYEVNENNGEALTTHGWATADAVDSALANGVKTTLCVTLFGSTNLTTFLTNATAKQTLIDNLITLVSARGAHGVNIDFEGLPASQKTNFANFMVSLADQMHAAIPGSEISSVLYAVDWSNVFDFGIMAGAVDHFIIMGYAYYYQGSSTTGPCDPLYHYGSTYNYTLSKSITYYLDKGCPKEKLVLGLPYYGYQWPTASAAVPSSTTGSGVAKTFAQIKTNTAGYYIPSNHIWDADSFTDIYAFNDGSNKQCFVTLEDGFRKRLEHVNNTGIAGIGIWALGYDNGYDELWNSIRDYFTDCHEDPCSGEIHDFGGPTKNYYNDEDYTWTIQPTGADQIEVNFSTFNIETGFDTLFIYDGTSTSGTLIGNYTGTSSPGVFTTSTGALTFYWKSDGATVGVGFNASYSCLIYDPVANFSVPVSPELCQGETITFTNSSSGATNYYWEFDSGTPPISTETNPSITYSASGTYSIILNAIDGVDTNTTISTIDVYVYDNPSANFSSSSPAFMPITQIYFTNGSSNATNYFWDFGDGNFSTDVNPWNDYLGAGDFITTLVAMNPACDNDTIINLVQVVNNLGISGPVLPETKVYPNPFDNKLTIENPGFEEETVVEIMDNQGKIIWQDIFLAENGKIVIDDLGKLAKGTYFIKLVVYGEIQIIPITKS